MKIPGKTMGDPMAGRALRSREIQHFVDVPCTAYVYVERAILSEHGADKRHRPYLHLVGELRGLVPDNPIYPELEEITFRPTMGPLAESFYEFSDDEIATMVGRGYFLPDFDVPAFMNAAEYELPVTADLLFLDPIDKDDVPVVFVQIDALRSLEVDSYTTGYDFHEQFEDVLHKSVEQAQDEHDLSREDWFAGIDPGQRIVDEPEPEPEPDVVDEMIEQMPQVEDEQPEPVDDLETMYAQVRSKVAAEVQRESEVETPADDEIEIEDDASEVDEIDPEHQALLDEFAPEDAPAIGTLHTAGPDADEIDDVDPDRFVDEPAIGPEPVSLGQAAAHLHLPRAQESSRETPEVSPAMARALEVVERRRAERQRAVQTTHERDETTRSSDEPSV